MITTELEVLLRQQRKEKNILLMTHIVLGYPSFATNREVIAQMVAAGVDCIEMQIPFSEPMADGPVIVKANQDSLAAGTTVADCLRFGAEMAASHAIPFLYMTYYNVIYKYGEAAFFAKTKADRLHGLIVPDLPPEMGASFFQLAAAHGIAPILIFSPTTTEARMAELEQQAGGFIYCVARRGVTGQKSSLDDSVLEYLRRCRRATRLPIAVGFGIQNRADVQALTGIADMAVIGSETIRLVDSQSAAAVGPFIASLRPGA